MLALLQETGLFSVYLAVACPKKLLVGIEVGGCYRCLIILIEQGLNLNKVICVTVSQINIHQYRIYFCYFVYVKLAG
jgi:hypothetical protein